MVVNDTRVLPARLRLERPGGGKAEVLLLERLGENGVWEGLARPSRKLRAGQRLGPVELLEPLGEGRWRLRLEGARAGERAAAAVHPRAARRARAVPDGLRASRRARPPRRRRACTSRPSLLARLDVERVTLHVGLDTFRPVAVDVVEEHPLHASATRSRRRGVGADPRRGAACCAVGTTTVRVLESARPAARRSPGARRCSSRPASSSGGVDALLTNFHLPRSTLLALVMAFAGVEETRRLYQLAIAERYRFYSFGDAMLLL